MADTQNARIANIVAGLVGVGVGATAVHFLVRGASAAPGTAPGTRSTGSGSGGSGSSGSRTGTIIGTGMGMGGNSQEAGGSALSNRIMSDESAANIFALQALGYALGLTQSMPDAVFGPRTRDLVQLGQRAMGRATTTSFDREAMYGIHDQGKNNGVRLVPVALTSAASNRIRGIIGSIDQGTGNQMRFNVIGGTTQESTSGSQGKGGVTGGSMMEEAKY